MPWEVELNEIDESVNGSRDKRVVRDGQRRDKQK
jgi:hypothetical protein